MRKAGLIKSVSQELLNRAELNVGKPYLQSALDEAKKDFQPPQRQQNASVPATAV